MNFKKAAVLIVGDDRTAFSLAVCLLKAEHSVTLYTGNKSEALEVIDTHLSDLGSKKENALDRDDFDLPDQVEDTQRFKLAILITPEDLKVKQACVQQWTTFLSAESLITVNTESIPLSHIQKDAVRPERIIGANWVEPVHTTYFLEIISNQNCRKDLVDDFRSCAKASWEKDPYVLHNDTGIRSRMMSAMVREAFYLLENDYVSVEDVDRACRNDPGYYLPFAGHCRYMDLMGSYIYGLVMKELNPELSKDTHIPSFFTRMVEEGSEGFQNGKGFYAYTPAEAKRRLEEFRKFSDEIRDIISKYPFHYLKGAARKSKKVVSDI
jgi:3-hydroxybutyryl-CoA dehydrogenase